MSDPDDSDGQDLLFQRVIPTAIDPDSLRTSWPCLSRPSTPFFASPRDVDGRVSAFGRPGHDDQRRRSTTANRSWNRQARTVPDTSGLPPASNERGFGATQPRSIVEDA